MKIRVLSAMLGICLVTEGLLAQSQSSKGHFIFGSDLIQYNAGNSIQRYNGGTNEQDTVKNTFSNISLGINVWVGYFVSNRVCVGLKYDFQQSPIDYYYNSYPYNYYYPYYPALSLFPSNLFFRYNFIRADSGGFFDLGIEGTFGVQYTGSTNTTTPEYRYTTTYTTTSVTNYLSLNSGVNLLASFHISKHFALQLKAGIIVAYQNIDFASESISPPSNNFNFTPEKVYYTTYSFAGSFRLQFYL